MSWEFEYFKPAEFNWIDDFSKAITALANAKAMVDSSLLIMVEAAERGDFRALCEATRVFSWGEKGIPRNYQLAKKYHEAIFEAHVQLPYCPEVMVETYRNLGLFERRFGNIEVAKEHFVKAAKMMVDELSINDWRFDVFDFLQNMVTAETLIQN